MSENRETYNAGRDDEQFVAGCRRQLAELGFALMPGWKPGVFHIYDGEGVIATYERLDRLQADVRQMATDVEAGRMARGAADVDGAGEDPVKKEQREAVAAYLAATRPLVGCCYCGELAFHRGHRVLIRMTTKISPLTLAEAADALTYLKSLEPIDCDAPLSEDAHFGQVLILEELDRAVRSADVNALREKRDEQPGGDEDADDVDNQRLELIHALAGIARALELDLWKHESLESTQRELRDRLGLAGEILSKQLEEL